MSNEIEKGDFSKPVLSAVTVEEYAYEKVKKSDVVINIPQEPLYFQEYNHRVVIGLFPQRATWSDNSVFEIQVIKITDKTIERTFIRTSSQELSDVISRFDIKNKTQEESLQDKVVRYLKYPFADDRVSREVFLSKYERYLEEVSVVALIETANDHEERPPMTKNAKIEKCPECGSEEISAMTPRTLYECGSSDYDQRPGTFEKSVECHARSLSNKL